MPQQLPLLVPNPSIPQDFQQTAFAHDLVGRYVCSTWDEAVTGNGGAPFDAVVVGAGMFGGYCADKLYRFGDEGNLRILVLDAGALLVTTHLQNLPKIGLNAPGARVVRTNAEDPGTQNVVWGFPWHSDRAFPGLAYCVGGRSVFWGGWAPRLVADDLKRWPDEVRKHLLDDAAENYVFVEQEIGVAEPTDYLETDFSKANVVTLYLLQSLNEKLKPKLLKELKPGSRVVSHAFSMGADWPPEQTVEVGGTTIYLWTIPKKSASR